MTLALSNEQLEILHDAADAVPANWRSRFIASIADRLTCLPNPSNRQFVEVVSEARRAFALGHNAPAPPNARRAPYRRRATG